MNRKRARKRLKSIRSTLEIPVFDYSLHLAKFLEKAAMKLAEAREVGVRLGVEATECRVVDLILLSQVGLQGGKETRDRFPDAPQVAPLQGREGFVKERSELPMLLRNAFIEGLRLVHRAGPPARKRSWLGALRGARV
jgi:hypothetical protein